MTRSRWLVLVGAAALVLGGLMVSASLRLTTDPDVEANLGSPVFRVGEAPRLARSIDSDGPLLFQDPLGRGRHVYLEHSGTKPASGWSAVEVVSDDGRCRLEWDRRRDRYTRPCPSNRRYGVKVERGIVVLDLRRD